MVPHADLANIADFWNEIVVDGRGNVYLNSIAVEVIAGADPTAGIMRVSRRRPSGSQSTDQPRPWPGLAALTFGVRRP